MQNALEVSVWPTVEQRLTRASAVLLALDFDGTLAPIVESPDRATVSGPTLALLKSLAQEPRYRVAIVSGRALADVKRRIGIGSLIYCGNHGLEIEMEGQTWQAPGVKQARGALRKARKELRSLLRSLPGVVLEDKGLSLSIHYRQASTEMKQTCLRLCSGALGPLVARRKVNIIQGKEVLEVQPALPWDKGACLRHLANLTLSGLQEPGMSLFLGDDTFDEAAFQTIREMGGIGIVVGEKAGSAAAFFLPSTKAVEIFLDRLANIPRDR